MKNYVWLLGCAPFLLAACEEIEGTSAATSERFITDLPPSLRELAAPYQDLSAVRLDPASGCYVYRYRGPVETTMLPLRTTDGRPLCVKKAETAPAT
ncbi:hypothetical protein [Roseovarius dicentrarchi]|uniref:hypothetical protein n=1 Tax=Roseovarius dicentrarchi TaxID=2250573 RepID=UPI000DEA153D|nr:hypothetical protein [Roseovarius dicentrarchi]